MQREKPTLNCGLHGKNKLVSKKCGFVYCDVKPLCSNCMSVIELSGRWAEEKRQLLLLGRLIIDSLPELKRVCTWRWEMLAECWCSVSAAWVVQNVVLSHNYFCQCFGWHARFTKILSTLCVFLLRYSIRACSLDLTHMVVLGTFVCWILCLKISEHDAVTMNEWGTFLDKHILWFICY